MQAHALTPRLVKALENTQQNNAVNTADVSEPGTTPHKIHVQPEFPFLSVLASGGHTLLIHSASLTHHEILASTNDIAVGECLDKAARTVLPSEVLQNARSTMYGAVLEQFAFSETPKDPSAARDVPVLYSLENSSASDYKALYETRYAYLVPRNREEAKKQNLTRYGWAFSQPLSQTSGGLKDKSMEMSFSGLTTAVERVVRFGTDAATGKLNKVERSSDSISIDERRDMAREVMRAAFEHIASRVVLALQQSPTPVDTVVMAGGVAANSFLRYMYVHMHLHCLRITDLASLASTLVNKGYSDIKIVFPPPSLCTDNAAMIAWAGLEMYQAGFKDPRSIRSIRKWPLDKLLTPPKDDRVA
jgi:N6-L-threonylcarbamoyladenine synthase